VVATEDLRAPDLRTTLLESVHSVGPYRILLRFGGRPSRLLAHHGAVGYRSSEGLAASSLPTFCDKF